jgi:DNA-binding transcriptional LysR family regulator
VNDQQSFTPTISQLRALGVVFDTRRFGRSPEQRSAEWNKVFRLEAGINSLRRNAPPVQLTVPGSAQLSPAGLELAGHAKRVLDAMDSFLQACKAVSSTRLVVGCFPEHAAQVAVATRSIVDRGVPVELMVSQSSQAGHGADMVEAVARSQLDLAVVTEQPLPEGLVSRKLYSWSIRCVVSHDHPLAGRTSCELTELTDQRILATPLGQASRAMIDATGAVKVEFEHNSVDALVALARSGWGIALVADDSIPLRASDPLGSTPGPVVHHEGHPLRSRVVAVTREHGPDPIHLEHLINQLEAMYAEDRRSEELIRRTGDAEYFVDRSLVDGPVLGSVLPAAK